MEKLKINKIVKPTAPVLIQAVVFEGCLMLVKNYWELKLGREYIHLVVGIDGEGSLNFLQLLSTEEIGVEIEIFEKLGPVPGFWKGSWLKHHEAQ